MAECAHPDIRDDHYPFGSGWIARETVCDDPTRRVDIRYMDVAENGTWKVSVQCTPGTRAVFGQRRNMVRLGECGGETVFYTCLTEYIPSMSTKLDPGLRLFASCAGGSILSMTAEKVRNVRRVFIAGDSTVADQSAQAAWYPYDSYCGWGQMLSLFLRNDAVCNQAHSGMTARCFMTDGHFGIVKRYLEKGDPVLIQFGHNDQKRSALQPFTGYTEWLKKMIGEIREKGGIPVLLSPVSRVPGKDINGPFDLLSGHSAAVKKLAEEEGLLFIDLHGFTFERYVKAGNACRDFFRPGDQTHGNDPGALINAQYAAACLNTAKLAQTEPVSLPDFFLLDRERDTVKGKPSPLPAPYLDIDVPGVSRDLILRAVQKGLMDPCVAYAHPGEPLPRGQFIQLLFRAAGLRGEGTNGSDPCPDVGPYEWDSSYAMAAVRLGMVPDGKYRSCDPVTEQEARFLCEKAGYPGFFGKDGVPDRYRIISELLRLSDSGKPQ